MSKLIIDGEAAEDVLSTKAWESPCGEIFVWHEGTKTAQPWVVQVELGINGLDYVGASYKEAITELVADLEELQEMVGLRLDVLSRELENIE